MVEAISDTGPVLHLWEIGRAHVLDVFERVLLPSLVAEELSRYGVEPGAQALKATLEVASVGEEERRQVLAEPGGFALHAADAEVLVLARRTEFRFPALTDDLALRRRLEAEGAEVSGSFGVLIRAYKKGLLERMELKSAVEALFSASTLHAGPAFRAYARVLLAEIP
ncbi:MAG: hypothetical protein HY900_19850 [Deltaproteobacteria bacterium]|nr:hypothetical protein [Deltaproteobacteria bacterium]